MQLASQSGRGGPMVTASLPASRTRARSLLAAAFSSRTASLPTDLGLVAARTVLAWIFIYYGGGKLFGWFNGLGIHGTALYFSNTAHLHPGGFFAVLGGVTELGGGILIALGLGTRLVGLALFADMVIAMITVTWATGISSQTSPPGYQINLAVGVLALLTAASGAGRFSLDALAEHRIAALKE
jgi:putative oxidoreductase